jgi:hypothetical protein
MTQPYIVDFDACQPILMNELAEMFNGNVSFKAEDLVKVVDKMIIQMKMAATRYEGSFSDNIKEHTISDIVTIDDSDLAQ